MEQYISQSRRINQALWVLHACRGGVHLPLESVHLAHSVVCPALKPCVYVVVTVYLLLDELVSHLQRQCNSCLDACAGPAFSC